MSYNLYLKSTENRKDIELMRQASLLIHNLKRRKINRSQINNVINNLDGHEQDKFKEYLNKYRCKYG